VKHLLDFSRKQNITFNKVDIALILEKSISLSKHKLQSKNIDINYQLPSPSFTNGSANHLEQVFVNLLLNSIDAISEKFSNSSEQNGQIDVFVKNISDKIYIHFKDNGAGIPESLKDKVFDPFFTSKNVGEGTGLGLSISFNLIKEHKGNLFFSSKEGEGTEFIIELPKF